MKITIVQLHWTQENNAVCLPVGYTTTILINGRDGIAVLAAKIFTLIKTLMSTVVNAKMTI